MIWLRRAGWTVAAGLLLMLLAWLTLPWIVQSQGQKRLTALLGREVTIGKVDVRPWSLELTLHDVAVAGVASQPPLLDVPRLYVNLQATSIWHRGVVIKALQLDQPAVRVTRTAEGHYDIDDLIARFTPKTPAEPAGAPLRFALANVEIRGGSLRFDDRPARRVHELSALDLALPFVSDLPADVAVTVKPHLSFALNGAAFDSGAESTPFSADRASSLTLRVGATDKDELDLAPWLGYLPSSLPVRVVRGRVGARIDLRFATRADGTPSLSLRGEAHVADLAMTDIAGAPLVGWKRLAVGLRDVQPLAHRVSLGDVVLDGATLQATRDAQGRINLATLASPATPANTTRPPAIARSAASTAAASTVASTSASASPSAVAPAASAASSTTAPVPWQVTVESLALNDAGVQWHDASTRPAAALAIEGLNLRASGLQWPSVKPQPVKIGARIGVIGAPPAGFATLALDGTASDREAGFDWTLSSLRLDGLAPYLAGVMAPKAAGTVDARGRLDWAGGTAPRLVLGVASAEVGDFRLTPDGTATPDAAASAGSAGAPSKATRRAAPVGDDAIAFRSLRVTQATIDLTAHRASIGSVALQAPSARIERDAAGRWNVLQWIAGATPGSGVPAAASVPAAAPSMPARAASAPSAAASPWNIRLADFSLDDGRLRFADARPRARVLDDAAPVRLDVSGLKIGVKGVDWSAAIRPAVPPMQVTLAATLGRIAERQATNGPASRVDWSGSVALQPLAAKGTLRLQRIPVHVFAAYVDNPLRIALRRAYFGWRGDIAMTQGAAGVDVDLGGEARLGDVSVVSLDAPASARPSASAASAVASTTAPSPVPGAARDIANPPAAPDELLRWQRLSLNGVRFQMHAGNAPRLDIAAAELADLYARLVVTEQGRLNLQDVRALPVAGPASAAQRTVPGASSVSASAVVAAASAASGSAPAASSGVSINVEGTTLVNGRIDFADHFVKPNYSAALTELNGSLGAFRSGSTDMAALELKGRAEGSALLEISGRLNPTANPLALDIHAKATDLELAPLSPYAGKYAGYAIQRGKLSMDVAYRIDPDGRLEASNRVVINQLTFGDRIDSPQATKLPVRLAIALLKDRNGVINLNMPVSGSLNDPQFSVAGLIGRVLLNVLVKAVTSPFSLLGGGGGGGGDAGLSEIVFRPGTATLADGQQAALDKVAGALADRPSLNMTITGISDPSRETDAYRAALLDQQLVAERRRELIRSGGAATPVLPAASAASAPITLDAATRERLVRQLYERSDLPDKPKNFIGLAKGVPAPEMEQRLKDAEPASPEAMRELALQRGLAVRDALIGKGLKSERVFLAAPKVGAGEARGVAVEGAASGGVGGPAAWVPRAELALGAE